MGRLDGKVALITGGSRGIGEAMARAFAAEGASVVNGSTSAPSYPDIAGVTFDRLDVRRHDEVREVIERVIARHGRLDVLVNAAGIEIEKPVTTTSVEEWDDVMAVNVRGVYLTGRYAVAHLARTRGVIINIASVNATWAEPDLAAYSASKAAVLQLTRCMALDHGPEGVRSVAICPGYIRTAMLEQYVDAQADPAAVRASLAGHHPLGRLGEPSEVAAFAVFLASDDARFLTGHGYTIDGGLTTGRATAWAQERSTDTGG